MVKVYTPSGNFNPSIFVYVAVSAVVLFAAGAAYQFAVSWIPYIYLDCLLTIVIGLAVGAAASTAVNKTKCRNRTIALLSAAILAIAALAGSHYWGFYDFNTKLAAAALEDTAQGEEDEVVQQLTPEQYVAFRTATGWSVGKGSHSTGDITGLGVYAVWLIEACIVLGFALTCVYDKVRSPFCERCNDWNVTPQVAVSRRSSLEKAPVKVKEAKTSDDLLLTLPKVDEGETPADFVYTISKCSRCADLDTLSVEMVYQKQKGKKQETKRKTLWRHVLLSRSQTSALESEKSVAA